MSCPACTPTRPCEVCLTLGQPLGLLPEPAPVAALVPRPVPVAPVPTEDRFDRLMARLQAQLTRGDHANAATTRMLIRDHCRTLRMPVPDIAKRQRSGPGKQVAA
jgi:hypothetical protein